MKAGKKWHGYVKNLRKDGSHYWVYATAVPNMRHGQTWATPRCAASRRARRSKNCRPSTKSGLLPKGAPRHDLEFLIAPDFAPERFAGWHMLNTLLQSARACNCTC
jgi:hypothetical protein